MDKFPKIIALYLPQFHRIPENDKFWGEGFTDWVTVKKAKPLFEGHNQPRVPLNDNYYDLSQKENVAWQAKLAKEYGIYGFGIYHYWFNNEQNLLTKPAEIIRDNDDIDINYCFIWDNTSWKRSWSNVPGNDWAPIAETNNEHSGPKILIKYVLGNESDWEKHYQYVRTHFHNRKYIKVDNKPVFCIFNLNSDILKMSEYWDVLAKKDGFDGMYFIFKDIKHEIPSKFKRYNYEPHISGLWNYSLVQKVLNRLRRVLPISKKNSIKYYDFDKIWNTLLTNAEKCSDDSLFYGAFVGYDDTPRRGVFRGSIVKGGTPEKFQTYFTKLLTLCQRQRKDFVFLSAWNEWGEGMMLEPDTINKYAFLEVIKHVITSL
ncbi:MAG: glycoside hydrolase family 99-like domain-containing protein [Bacteroidales bacterium]|nr:glycoside hydrolase family 99-like domain-containing protein [Bacteroidales bacterium]